MHFKRRFNLSALKPHSRDGADGAKKAEEYAAVGLYREAAEAAARARDSDMLTKIQGMVGTSSPLGVAVSQIKDRLQSSLR
eukprot:jgi/Botrbrau1/22969/Bobra.0030s0041.1